VSGATIKKTVLCDVMPCSDAEIYEHCWILLTPAGKKSKVWWQALPLRKTVFTRLNNITSQKTAKIPCVIHLSIRADVEKLLVSVSNEQYWLRKFPWRILYVYNDYILNSTEARKLTISCIRITQEWRCKFRVIWFKKYITYFCVMGCVRVCH